MSDAPLVTIITPAYNAERYIDACIGSALAQTFGSFEQIIVDDGSTDTTAERVTAWRDPRLRYIRLPHRGLDALAASYNSALEQARGSLIAILEADDFWPPDKLARQTPAFSDGEVQLCWGNAIVVDQDDRMTWRWATRRSHADRDIGLDSLFRLLARSNVLTPTVTVMARRQALQRIGGFHQRAGAPFVDLPTWLLLSARNQGKARHLDATLGYYRTHPAQTSQMRSSAMFSSQLAILDSVLAELEDGEKRALGWTERDHRGAAASAAVLEGVGNLRAGRRDNARVKFVRALRDSDSLPLTARAAAGVLSTVIGFDLLEAVTHARQAVSRAMLRFTTRAATTPPATR